MPNKLLKHITATLAGQSTAETLDIYDDTAVHTSAVANNLTTNTAGYVLDARQGKALNDSFAEHITYAQRKPLTVSSTISEGSLIGELTFTFNNTFSAKPIVFFSVGTDNANGQSQHIGIAWYSLDVNSVVVRLRALKAVDAVTLYVDCLAIKRNDS